MSTSFLVNVITVVTPPISHTSEVDKIKIDEYIIINF